MREDGYTLAEALAALLIIGLAMGGLFEGARVLSRMQRASAEAVLAGRETKAVQAAFATFVAAPAMADAALAGKLEGGPASLVYDCPGEERCTAVIETRGGRPSLRISDGYGVARQFRLEGPDTPNFVYISTLGRFLHWPSEHNHGTLRSIVIVRPAGGVDLPLLSARVWIEQSRTCEYDLISRTCRTPPP